MRIARTNALRKNNVWLVAGIARRLLWLDKAARGQRGGESVAKDLIGSYKGFGFNPGKMGCYECLEQKSDMV